MHPQIHLVKPRYDKLYRAWKREERREAHGAVREIESLITEAIRLANKHGFRDLEKALRAAEWEVPNPEDIE